MLRTKLHHLLKQLRPDKGGRMARRSKRKGVLDWWQTVLDETKGFQDNGNNTYYTDSITVTRPQTSCPAHASLPAPEGSLSVPAT